MMIFPKVLNAFYLIVPDLHFTYFKPIYRSRNQQVNFYYPIDVSVFIIVSIFSLFVHQLYKAQIRTETVHNYCFTDLDPMMNRKYILFPFFCDYNDIVTSMHST